jgi:signal transduction histidine kinase
LIVVRDDGGGVEDVEQLNLGRGLKNMRKRARLLGGHIKFQNYRDGFTVILRFRNRPDGEQTNSVMAA